MAQQQKNFWDTPAGTFFKWTTPVGMIGSAISGIGDFFGGGGSSQKNQAYDDLMKFQQTKPGDYSSQYADEINSLMDQLNNRKFEYDYTQDPAYQYYQSLYKQQAQRAGEHAQATASALGGGYGNSWAATAGTSAYDAQMDDVINGLYSQALNEYNDETAQLQGRLESLYGAEQNAQNEYAQKVNNWYNQQSYYQNRYDEAVRQEQQQNQLWGDIGNTILDVGVKVLPYLLGMFL